ncbi:hypothetical protein B0T18DRAFT_89581 [Schizothecium vesticola]|uniref:ZZ-type domain-containing protein n=1 Tax=Schizothecium vesticola TaxID=314040 RepID=A0AA40F727_9PEZI|nr:hypothetical protein B0T18DRAFT_89581 [Schizothecium vesticola]
MAAPASRFTGQDEPGLYLVHPQDTERERQCTCDIFVVHGLRGGATSSWRHPDSGTIWFQHLLPEYIRNQTSADSARIWTFGYPAYVTFQAAGVYELALDLLNRIKGVRKGYENRKIIWVCHSLGGIVVKHAMIEAQLNPRYLGIRTSTAGIVFLATPHQGSNAANFGNIIAGVANAVTPGISFLNRDMIRDLKKGSPALFEISSKFSNICTGISIHTFYETGGAHLIVDRTSAVLNLTNEVTRHPLRVAHREMGKFRDAYDQNWIPVASSIVELVLMTTASTPSTLGIANTSRTVGGGWTYSPEPSVVDPSPPPQHQGLSHDYSQQSSGPTRDSSPRTQPPSGSPSPAQQWTAWREQPTVSSPTASRSYPSLNQTQSRLDLRSDTSSSSVSTAGSSSFSGQAVDPGDMVAVCDGCGRDIGSAAHRVQCTVCYDYDLCASCFQSGKVSKNHSSDHKVSHVLNTLLLMPDDLVPAREAVNPPINVAKGRKNWSLVQLMPNTPANPSNLTITQRRLHLFDNDSHARFRAYARPGHYGISIDVDVHFDPDLDKNAAARQHLLRRVGGAGKLRVTLGVVTNNQQFAGTRFPEDSFSDATVTPGCLPNRLFRQGFRGSVVSMNVGATDYNLRPDSLLHVEGSEDSVVGIGLIVQWSDVPSYQQSTDPVVSIDVLQVRMYNVLDYNEPYIRAPPPSPPRTAVEEEDEEDDGTADDDTSVEEFLAALMRIQRAAETAQEKARLEALVRQRLAQQEQAKREAVGRLYLQAMSQAIKEAAEEEERQRKEAALVLFFQSLGLRR